MQNIDWKKLQNIWQHHPKVIAVWVFGSAQDGFVRTGSDVDFGVLFYEKPILDDLADLRAELQETLQLEDIDVVPLNDASPILCFEALCGRCLYSADDVRRVEFTSFASREYEDEMAMLKKYAHI